MKRKGLKKIFVLLFVLISSLFSFNTVFGAVNRISTPPAGWQLNTPAENIFKIQGSDKTFILLDTTADNNSKFFILSKDAYGTHAYDPDKTQKFDITDPNNIAYWLNNDFKTNGNGSGKVLPQGILSHIDYQHVWQTEGGFASGNCPDDYTTTAGIVLLSQTEWLNNITKFGVKDNIAPWGWWLRTGRGIGGGTNVVLGVPLDVSVLGQTHVNSADYAGVYVRPAFYLDKSFFTEVKLDTTSMGSNVKAAIKSTYTWDELKYGNVAYSSSELISMGFEQPAWETDTQAPTWTQGSSVWTSDVTANSLKLTWTPAVDENGVAAYKIYMNTSVVNAVYSSVTDSVYGSVYQSNISGLEPYTLYNIKIEALDRAGNISGNGPTAMTRTGLPEGKLVPTDDAYVNGGSKAALNYGAAVDLIVKTDVPDLTRQTFFKFDLSTIDSDIGSATLNLYGAYTDGGAGTQINDMIFGVEEDNWSENTLVWTNKPQADSYLGTININRTWGWKTIDVTSFIRQQYAKDKLASFEVTQQEVPGRGTFFKSKEDKVFYPYLTISRDRLNPDAPLWTGDSSVIATKVGENEITLTWTQAVDTGAVSYRIVKDGSVVDSVYDNTYTVRNLTVGTKYTFKIEACDENGNVTNDGPMIATQTQNTVLEQVKLGNIFLENEQIQFKISTGRTSLRWFAYDVWGRKVHEGREIVSGNSATITIPVTENGYYDLEIYVEDQNKADIKLETSFALLSQYDFSNIDDSFFSMCTHLRWIDKGWGPQLVELLNRAGIKNIRDEISWGSVESTKGVYTYSKEAQELMAEAEKYNINPFIIFSYINPNYDNNSTPYTEEGRLGFANYGKALLEKYGDQIKWVEVYNEFNLGFGDQGNGPADSKASYYYELLKKTYEVVKAYKPDVTVVGPTSAGIPVPWLEEFFSLGGLNYLDGVSVHPYNYPRTPEGLEAELDKLANLIKQYNNGQMKPMWISEVGWPTHATGSGVDEKTQSDYLVRSHVIALSKGVEKLFWYDFMNDGLDKSYNEDNFGIIRNSKDSKGKYTPKPAYAAYAAMTRQLTTASFVEKENRGKNIFSFKFTRDNQDLRVLWALTPENVTIKTTNSIEITDYMGNTKTYNPVNGEIYVTLTGEPIYVKGSLQEILTGGNLSITADSAVVGEPVNLNLGVNNISTSPANVSFEINGLEYSFVAGANTNEIKEIALPAFESTGTFNILSNVKINGNLVGSLQTDLTVGQKYELKMRPHVVDTDTREAVILVEANNRSKLSSLTVSKLEWSVETISGNINVDTVIEPDSKHVFEIPVGTIDFWTSYPVSITAVINGSSVTIYNGKLDFSPILKKTVSLDENIDETASGIDLSTGAVKISSGYNGAEDLSGKVWLNWDDDKLYFYAKILDDINAYNVKDADIWQNDGIQLGIIAGVPGENNQWYEYGISQTPVGPQIYRWLAPAGIETGSIYNGELNVSRDEVNKYTIYKLALPWEELVPIQPGEDHVISISIVVNDNDGTKREGYLEWGSGIGGTKDPGKFRTIEFMPGATERTALIGAISHAQAVFYAAEEGTTIGKYPFGKKVVLQNAIQSARLVMDNLYTSQEKVDLAVETLNKAVQDFEKSQITEVVQPEEPTDNENPVEVPIPTPAPVPVPVPVPVVEVSSSTLPDGRKMDLVKLDNEIIKESIKEAEDGKKTIYIQVPQTESEVIRVEVPVSSFKDIKNAATLSVATGDVSCSVPLKAIISGEIEKLIGNNADNATLLVSIEKLSDDKEKALNEKAKQSGLNPIGNSVEFGMRILANSKEVEISDFGKEYMTRSLMFKTEETKGKTTVVWYNPRTDGFEFVPATTKKVDENTQINIKSTQNGIFMTVSSHKSFEDIKEHWAKDDIEQLASKLLVKGITDQSFNPENNITRAEFTVLLTRALTLGQQPTDGNFSDIKVTDWYAGAIGAAIKAGLINGYEDGTFRPDANITREEATVLMTRAIKIAGSAIEDVGENPLSIFADNENISSWAKDSVSQMANAGLVKGMTDSTFVPHENITRAQVAAILNRVLRYVDFAD